MSHARVSPDPAPQAATIIEGMSISETQAENLPAENPAPNPELPSALYDPVPAPVVHLDAAALEWQPLLALIASYAVSRPGRESILALVPSTDQQWIERQHQLVAEVRLLLDAAASIALGGLFDPTSLAAKSQIPEAALEPDELQAVARLAGDIAAWQSLLRNPPPGLRTEAGPSQTGLSISGSGILSLIDLSAPLTRLSHDLKPLAEAIQRKLLPDGSLADDASPELSRIRREQQRQQRVIEESLRSALRRLSSDNQTQDNLITIRGDRFVIPVKAELKRRVSGVVHGASSSGQTVYVEPLETIEQNNELVRLLEEEQAEIHRIFVALTRLVGTHAEALVAGARVLVLVDSFQARARFSQEYDCARPAFSAQQDTAVFRLEAARHPLLEKRLRASSSKGALSAKIVPFTLELQASARQLILSGPNTGGKTVTLKTTALLAMMAQSGIPVPAAAQTQPVFSAFLADIGDAQSIEQALSTFSAHIVNLDRIARLARLAQQDSLPTLILLDELGSATDPDEGSALAVAVADYFRRTGVWSLISTHHTSLKVYAANTAGVVNAAAGVDELTLIPNYQLRLGVPGASAGIQTAERLGLNPEIVRAARERLGTQQVDIARFLESLHCQLTDLEVERKAAREAQYSLNQERARLAREGDLETKKRTKELEQKLASLLKDFEYQLRQAVSAIEDKSAQLKLSKESERRIQALRRDFEQQFNSTVVAHKSGADQGDPNAQPHLVKHVAPGDQIRIKSMNKIATVTREVEKNLYEVALGALKMRIRHDDIAEVLTPVRKSGPGEKPLDAVARQKGVRVTVTSSSSENMRSEINLIGHTVDEAVGELEKYLDQAFLAGLPRVRIIHGTGMGVLRRALREFLRTHPHVASVTEPTHQEGGAGATVAELRQ